MSKIYEALEQAQKEKTGFETVPHVAEPERRSVAPEIYSFELEIEEEMVNLYRSIESLIRSRKRMIQFIGSWEGEGTSTVAREFARVAIMRLGQSVLLVDADRHNPTQHFFCNVSPQFCLDEVGDSPEALDRAIYQVGNSSLFVSLISRGSNSAHLFQTTALDPLWDVLKERFDLILIDSPPAVSSPEGLTVFDKADGVVMVVEADKTRWPVVESVKDRITHQGGNVLGVVLNKRRYYIPDFIYKRL